MNFEKFWEENLSMCWPQDREYVSLKQVMPYQRRGQIHGWPCKYFHSSDNFHTRNLTYKDLVLGNDSIEVDTIDSKIRFKIKEGTKIGSILRVPGKGFNRDNKTGDMILETWLDVPTNLSEEEKETLEKGKYASSFDVTKKVIEHMKKTDPEWEKNLNKFSCEDILNLLVVK